MITFHCFPSLDNFGPYIEDLCRGTESHTAQYYTEWALAQLDNGSLPFTENCQAVLRELADMSYVPAFHCAKDANGKLFGLFDLPRHVCEALAATAAAETGRADQLLMHKELVAGNVLHALHALPLEIHFVITFIDYRSIARILDAYCDAGTEYMLCCDKDDNEFFAETDESKEARARALAEFNFSVEANGKIYRVCMPEEHISDTDVFVDLTDFGEDRIICQWGYYVDIVYEKLLTIRRDLPAPLHPVQTEPIPSVGKVDGIQVMGRLLFDPARWFGPNRGMMTIVHRNRGVSTAEDSIVPTRDLKVLCEHTHARAKEANGTAISLVTTAYLYTEQDFSVLDTVLYCITATADSITVTDYRDALGDFATAIKNYLL